MKYQCIEHHKQEFPVVVMCKVLGVSESGFYAWRKRPACRRTREDAQLTQEIRQVYATHRGRYGSPRIQRELQDQGRSTSRKRVARLMREAALSARRRRRRVLTTKRDATHPVAPNVLDREFAATEPNTKWVTDITSIPTTQGWLAPFGDPGPVFAGGGGMVHVNPARDEELAAKALQMAIGRRRPQVGLVHSDRGCQYTSHVYRHRLEQAGMIVSMSRKSNCWDNATMESFFGSLKEECVGNTLFASHEETRSAIFTYLEVDYNPMRRHSTLGYVSPLLYEQRTLQQAKQNIWRRTFLTL